MKRICKNGPSGDAGQTDRRGHRPNGPSGDAGPYEARERRLRRERFGESRSRAQRAKVARLFARKAYDRLAHLTSNEAKPLITRFTSHHAP